MSREGKAAVPARCWWTIRPLGPGQCPTAPPRRQEHVCCSWNAPSLNEIDDRLEVLGREGIVSRAFLDDDRDLSAQFLVSLLGRLRVWLSIQGSPLPQTCRAARRPLPAGRDCPAANLSTSSCEERGFRHKRRKPCPGWRCPSVDFARRPAGAFHHRFLAKPLATRCRYTASQWPRCGPSEL